MRIGCWHHCEGVGSSQRGRRNHRDQGQHPLMLSHEPLTVIVGGQRVGSGVASLSSEVEEKESFPLICLCSSDCPT